MEWNKEGIINFIEIYRKYELLWDPKHRDHYNKILKQDAWEEIAKQVNRSVDECKKKMEYLLAALRREKMKIMKTTGTGKGAKEVYKSSWFAFQSMTFLWDKNKPRSTMSTLPITADNQNNLEDVIESNEEIEDVEIPSEDNFEKSMDSVASTNCPGPLTTNENSEISTKASAATKRVHPPTPTSSQKKKRQKTTTDERLDKAFEILTSTSSYSTPLLDDSYHFGNLIASKLRLYNDDVRCAIQSDILNIFIQANIGCYNNRVSVLPDHVHYNNPHTSHTYTSPHSPLPSSSSQPPGQSSKDSQPQNQYQFQDQSQNSNQPDHTYQSPNGYGEESGIQNPTTAFLYNTSSDTLLVEHELQQL